MSNSCLGCAFFGFYVFCDGVDVCVLIGVCVAWLSTYTREILEEISVRDKGIERVLYLGACCCCSAEWQLG